MTGKKWILSMTILLVFGMLSSTWGVSAQESLPPARPFTAQAAETLPGNPYLPVRDAAGRWVAETQASLAVENRSQAIASVGGPDDYGYMWNDTEPLNWIDASGGVDLGLSPSAPQSGPVEIGFDFKYYENIYSRLYVSLDGVVGFTSQDINNLQTDLPDSTPPDNLIAPYWSPIDEVGGYVRYLGGGVAPNRWLVVEWNRVRMDSWSEVELDEFTYEIVLHENGDIVFQYGEMRIGGEYYMCQISGMEDAAGIDGLEVTEFCQLVSGNHAVRIVRPGPMARLNVSAPEPGRFARAGELVRFTAQVRNIGELGADTYDIDPTLSNPDWQVAYYHADGVTPLGDTNGNTRIDTGPVPQGATATIVVTVQVSNPANVGDATEIRLGMVSMLDPYKGREIHLRTAIPTHFAQAYMDEADGAQRLHLVRPDLQQSKRASAVGEYAWNGGVLELVNGKLWTTWEQSRCLTMACDVIVDELEYAILNQDGNFWRAPGKLTDLSGSPYDQYDTSPSSAVAPNGAVGIIWQRQAYNANGELNTNLYFAILDSSGNFTTPPVNLTNDPDWGSSATRYYQPRIAATGDNRFVMTWYTYDYLNGVVRDVYYAIRDWQNNPIATGQLTADTPGGDSNYTSPTVSALDNNRVLVAFSQYANQAYAIAYTVLDSAGNQVKPVTTIPGYGFGADAVQLSSDRILLAWTSFDLNQPQIRYALLSAPFYDDLLGAVTLENPASITGDDYVSVTRDQAGRGVLTWTDYYTGYRRNLYYALIANNGAVITAPMVFRAAQETSWGTQRLETNFDGQGNTTYTQATSSDEVDAYVSAPGLAGAPPEGSALIPVQFGNLGATPASDIVITATLDGSLSYTGDTLGITPEINGNTLTWTIPGELAFMGYGAFHLWVAVPDAPIGTRYPVALAITSAGLEAVPGNNAVEVEVMVAHQIALPVVVTVP